MSCPGTINKKFLKISIFYFTFRKLKKYVQKESDGSMAIPITKFNQKYLSELLEDKNSRNMIKWLSHLQNISKALNEQRIYTDIEFQILDYSEIANLWGIRCNKPSMTSRQFKRMLRYYCNKSSVLRRIAGKKNTYCFQPSVKPFIQPYISNLNWQQEQLKNQKFLSGQLMQSSFCI